MLEPNPLGLYDMLGDATEMTDTMYQLAGQTGGYTVRGGSFRTPEEDIRASLRTEQPRFDRDNLPSHEDSVGFRLVIASQVFTYQNLVVEKNKGDEVAHKAKLDAAEGSGTAPIAAPTSPAATPAPIAVASLPASNAAPGPGAATDLKLRISIQKLPAVTPSPHSELALTYLDAALHEAANITDPSHLIDVLCEIAKEKAKAGDIDASRVIFAQSKKMVLNLPWYVQVDCVALSKIAQAEAQAGDSEAARTILAEVAANATANDELWERATALSRLGQAQAIIGDPEDSQRTFEQADKTAALQKNVWNRNSSLVENADVRAQTEAETGNVEAARQTLVRAVALANAMRDSGFLTEIAQTQAQIGEVEVAKRTFGEALATALRMKETYDKGYVLQDLARAQAEAGDIDGANGTAARITDRYSGGRYTYKEEALAAIGNATAAAAQAQLLKRIQEQAKEGGATDAEAAVRTWGAAVDRCNGYVQIAVGLLSN
jgi:tetratricopeptide (TPR) repeat protein